MDGFHGLDGPFFTDFAGGRVCADFECAGAGFERIFARLDRRNHLKPGTRNCWADADAAAASPGAGGGGAFILPQFFSAINAVVTLIRDNTDQIERFAMELGLDPKIVSQKLSEVSQWIPKTWAIWQARR